MYGQVFENTLVTHKMLVPPKARGTVAFLASKGNYTLTDTMLELDFMGTKTKYTMLQIWPVRDPRPVSEKVTADYPLLTG